MRPFGARCAGLLSRWVRLSLRSRLPTGYHHWPLRGQGTRSAPPLSPTRFRQPFVPPFTQRSTLSTSEVRCRCRCTTLLDTGETCPRSDMKKSPRFPASLSLSLTLLLCPLLSVHAVPPAAPTNVRAVVLPAEVLLTWDASAGADHYRV